MSTTSQPSLPIDSLAIEAGKQGRREADLFRDYLKKLPEKGWLNQSFCTDWTIKDVAEHQVAQGMAVRDGAWAALRGKSDNIFSPELIKKYEAELHDLNRLELADRLAQSAHELFDMLEVASPEQLAIRANTPFGSLPLVNIGSIRLSELSLHSWDVRVVGDLTAKVSRESLPLLVPGLIEVMPVLVNREAARLVQNVNYQFEITGAARGPVALTIQNGQAQTRQGYLEKPDVTVKLDSETFLRLSWGRLKQLDWMIRDGWVKVEGDNQTALNLSQLFQGI